MKYFLGLDGGGSKTFTVVVDETGHLLGRGHGGPGNYQTVGIEEALRSYREAIEEALREAGITIHQVTFAEFGLAGADRQKDLNILLPAIETTGFAYWDVVCDTFEGLRTGSRENVGVILVCGSGTNAAGRNLRGDTVQIGGFGYLFGDTAGGHYLAQEAFRAAARAWDRRGPKTSLSEKIPRYHGLGDMGEVLAYYWDNDLYKTSLDMCKLLHEAADEGDEMAIQILRACGEELGVAANAVIDHLAGFEGMEIPIVLVGSVIQKGRNMHLLNALDDEIRTRHDSFRLVVPEMAPVFGAVLLAMDHVGLPVTEDMEHQFVSYGGHEG
ncbi:N-acetylglucosamine kinase [Alicyclobacillus dauci]|uniref:ATPase n=1 Tax=Alicyclobacillus dauci TaxID=1475485 RepID=A0ABY6YZX8_9BACL|nr:BadF/BadG/BcrA/BcrD ATPase family protein [Alicyclobacillus dauci]WAH36055.1 ATPase [Alicyclobacillus dauci]